ncbi:hypothetical protein FH608_010440 [Nonomuraea phyllanthi]|uniref:Uncharacterized protein n=1 Tax=Nonomuraea phyllanthi TaxID=2219224 RepID=A0A5C4WRQ9_9ACTN|nr:hypothetical protein [Nonomuraea phyllanthi]KAB8195898.1 hypothetical protein FH608_010440 [Nonomuraea phyllanthi]QFY07352.1 hypothetical protein GBF35_12240 [Nonomuraea phyllanthi]
MTFLIAAVVLVGALCLFDLVLTFAVLRRLREHTAELARLASEPRTLPYDPSPLVGRTLPGSATRALPQPRLVAFFDADCGSCHEHAPKFAAAARPGTSLAFVTGAGRQVQNLVDVVGGVSAVVVAEEAASVAADLGIRAFPMFLQVDGEGRIVRADMDADRLAEMAATV